MVSATGRGRDQASAGPTGPPGLEAGRAGIGSNQLIEVVERVGVVRGGDRHHLVEPKVVQRDQRGHDLGQAGRSVTPVRVDLEERDAGVEIQDERGARLDSGNGRRGTGELEDRDLGRWQAGGGQSPHGGQRRQKREDERPDLHLPTKEPRRAARRKGPATQTQAATSNACALTSAWSSSAAVDDGRSISEATNQAMPIAIRMSPALAIPGNGGGRWNRSSSQAKFVCDPARA